MITTSSLILLVGGGIFTRTGVGIGWLAIKGRYKNPPPAVILTSGRTTRWSRFRDAPPKPPFGCTNGRVGQRRDHWSYITSPNQ
jgi:hypothetical protein